MRLIRTGAVRRRTIVLTRAARSRVDDVLVIAGIGCVAYGLGLWLEPVAWVFVGLALIGVVAFGGGGKRRG